LVIKVLAISCYSAAKSFLSLAFAAFLEAAVVRGSTSSLSSPLLLSASPLVAGAFDFFSAFFGSGFFSSTTSASSTKSSSDSMTSSPLR